MKAPLLKSSRRAHRAFLLLAAASVLAEDNPKEKKEPPAALLQVPLGVPGGTTSRVTIRGRKLDQATDARIVNDAPGVELKLVEKGKAAVPSQVPPGRAGDTQAVLELKLPADSTLRHVEVVFASPDGDSTPWRILVDRAGAISHEKEPNDGFREAQDIALDGAVEGMISAAQDVDVFRFAAQANAEVCFEVVADRKGSALDSILTLYDAAGHVVAVSDDGPDTRDSRLQVTLEGRGVYFLSLADAHDTGGPTHPYRLFAYIERTAAF